MSIMPTPKPVKTDQEKLAEIEDLFGFIIRVQDKLAGELVNGEEMEAGEGRKGVLLIRGNNKWTKVFEVRGGKLIPSNTVEHARTVIAFEGVDAFVTVCQELLAGNPTAFSRARAKGDVKVVGDFAMRDAAIFNRLLAKVGKILSSYNVKVGNK